jgi:hypothetical protein
LFVEGKVRLEFNPPGSHPFISLQPDEGGPRRTVLVLGARQTRYSHRGSSFPRVFCGSEELDSAENVRLEEAPGTSVSITDMRGGMKISTTLTPDPGIPVVHVVHALTAEKDVQVNRVFDRYDFLPAAGESGGLEYSFVPHLRPRENMVIGDHVLRSPAVMMEKDGYFFALVPDLEVLEEQCRTNPERYYMDFVRVGGENGSPAVCFGIGRTRPSGHVYFDERFEDPYPVEKGRTLKLAYHLLLDSGGYGPGDVVRFLWERYGRDYMRTGSPQVASLDRYASAGLSRIFKRSDLFRRFDLDGQQCGGTVAMHLLTRRGVRLMNLRQLKTHLRFQDVAFFAQRQGLERLSGWPGGTRLLEKLIYRHGPRVPPQVMFQSWFNNLRSAYGAYWFARKWNDQDLLERALAVKNLAILSPREEGAFPAVCYVTDEGIYWSRGTRGFKHVDWYHTADCATTAYYMVMWFKDHEGDPRLLFRCRELADFLLAAQLPSGAFPAWVRPSGQGMEVSPELRESATSACSAMFLSSLFLAEGDPTYIDAARRACDFLAEEVIGEQKWFDYETFFSCSRKRLGLYDPYTGAFPQNTMSMYWAAEAFRLAYLATGRTSYLELGRKVLDHLLMYQQVWNPPFLSIDAFGGFGVMNTDGEWNDSRQALFAPLLMDYYGITGDASYMERGIAALRASFTLMYVDENREVAAANLIGGWEREEGSVAENYGHFGYDHRTCGYLESDWGAGSACQAAAYAQRHYGDVFVDTDRMEAFGVNGCRVDGFRTEGDTIRLDVTPTIISAASRTVRVTGSRAPAGGVSVNGRPAERVDADRYVVML